MSHAERRTSHRLPVHRPVKLRSDQTGLRYLAGHTHNVSAHGALIQLTTPVPLVAGQRLQLGIADDARQALVHADDLLEATVVRSLRHDQSQYIAVRFASHARLAVAG